MIKRVLTLSFVVVALVAIFAFLNQKPIASYAIEQADQGVTIYGKFCITCHGDRGQGLAEWRFTWDEQHQNCSQPKCHGLNHPSDGFYMPNNFAPAIMGTNTLTHFQNARQLFGFISTGMPYQARGSLSQDEYWALTAFLLREHGVPPGAGRLDSTNADFVSIHPRIR